MKPQTVSILFRVKIDRNCHIRDRARDFEKKGFLLREHFT